MKDEAAFWSGWVQPLLHRPNFRRVAWKVPADTREGLPDVWFANPGWSGWLELKYVPEWPVRPTTGVTVKVTAEQLAHLREAGPTGQASFVLLGVDTMWFLIQERRLAPFLKLTRDELPIIAHACGLRGTDDRLLLTALKC